MGLCLEPFFHKKAYKPRSFFNERNMSLSNKSFGTQVGLLFGLTGVCLVGIAAALVYVRSQHADPSLPEPHSVTSQELEEYVSQHPTQFTNDTEIVLGVVSDIEGAISEAEHSASLLRLVQGLDGIIIAGDTYENEQIRGDPLYPQSSDNLQEMVSGIRPYAELGVPLFVIPGNHETQEIYTQGIRELRSEFPLVFDLNHAVADFTGINFVGWGGYHDSRFIAPEGFLLVQNDYAWLEEQLLSLQGEREPTVLITHGPPRSDTVIDYVPGIGHVGDEQLAEILHRPELTGILNIHGHIHEGGGTNATIQSDVAVLNVAAITSYHNPVGARTGVLILDVEKGNLSVQYVNLY